MSENECQQKRPVRHGAGTACRQCIREHLDHLGGLADLGSIACASACAFQEVEPIRIRQERVGATEPDIVSVRSGSGRQLGPPSCCPQEKRERVQAEEQVEV